jgi:hypothetical protein
VIHFCRSVTSYLSDIEKQLREERKQKIFDMWMACSTLEEIADAVGIAKSSTSEEITTLFDLGSFSKSEQSLAKFNDSDFTPPLYNVWTFAKKLDFYNCY